MNIKKLNEELQKYLQDLKIGDKVIRKSDKSYKPREGIITKKINDDVFEVEFPETEGLMTRTDRYYANELKLVN